MSHLRDEFLLNHWASYPEMPRGALRWGRVEQMRLGVQVLSDMIVIGQKEVKGSEVLVDGDLIALLPAQKVVLLAPNLTNRPIRDEKWPKIKTWFEFQTLVRQFFYQKRFQEVMTPTLVACPGTEPSLEVFDTVFQWESKKQTVFLTTSPELNIKKILAEGAERVFELAPVFRNGEKTERHDFQFIMLEWYRAFANLSAIKMDVIELIEQMADGLKVKRPLEVITLTVPQLFKEYCGFELKPETSLDELKALALKLGVDVTAAQVIDDYFYLIFMDRIENKWPQDRLVFVEKYPPYQAALARIGADGWAERFEVYWKGLELGNAFFELNDPAQQRLRSQDDLAKKKLLGRKEIGLDEKFFKALEYGLPPSAGIAVGAERLYMALMDVKDISMLKEIF